MPEVRAWRTANVEPQPRGQGYRSLKARFEQARHLLPAKASKGHAAISWPKAFGSSGGSEIQRIISQEEQSAFDVPTMHGTFFPLSPSI